MDYEEEMGGLEHAPILRISPVQTEAQARKFVAYPAGARCPRHEGTSSVCMDCRQVRITAEGMADRRSGRFNEHELSRRHQMRTCMLCDSRGLAKVRLDDGAELLLRCPHDAAGLNDLRVAAKEKAGKKVRARRVERAPGTVDYGEEVRKRLQQ